MTFFKQAPFLGNMWGDLCKQPSQAPHCHTTLIQRQATAGKWQPHACGRTRTNGKSIQLQTPLTPLQKFSGKDYIDFTHDACNSIPDTESRPFTCQESPNRGSAAEHGAHKKPVSMSVGSCHQTSAKGSSGAASYHTTSSQIQPFSVTVPECLKKCLSSSP